MIETLDGKTALITGAAKRLGRHIALALAAEGVNVVVHYNRSRQEADRTCAEATERGVNAWSLQADLSHPDNAQKLLQDALDATSGLDILVNNASTYPVSRLEDVTFDQLVSAAAVNAWAPFLLSRAFFDQADKGAIVNLLDTRLTGYDWNHAAYILSKHILAKLTHMTARAYAPAVTVNAVSPGLMLPLPGGDESSLERYAQAVPLKQRGTPEDITHAVLFLLKADFVTGQIIEVDGGRHLKQPPDPA